MRRSDFAAVLLTCEHGGNVVPARYKEYFRGQEALLATHRGWDIGALSVAKVLSRQLKAPLVAATVTRLVVDLNRSLGHKNLHSAFTKELPKSERDLIVQRHYQPYRGEVAAWLEGRVAKRQRVLHISVHSFTPELKGEVRSAEIGLLYDPRRSGEARFADDLHRELRSGAEAEEYRIRRNYPYKGTDDGFMTYLRKRLPAARYVGLEVEMNQAVVGSVRGRKAMARVLGGALAALVHR